MSKHQTSETAQARRDSGPQTKPLEVLLLVHRDGSWELEMAKDGRPYSYATKTEAGETGWRRMNEEADIEGFLVVGHLLSVSPVP